MSGIMQGKGAQGTGVEGGGGTRCGQGDRRLPLQKAAFAVVVVLAIRGRVVSRLPPWRRTWPQLRRLSGLRGDNVSGG